MCSESRKERYHTEFVYVGDDRFAFLQVGSSEPIERQHDERRTDETEKHKNHKNEKKKLSFRALMGNFKFDDWTEKEQTDWVVSSINTRNRETGINHVWWP